MSNVIDGMDRFGALELCSEREGERHVIALTGEFDLAAVEPVTTALLAAEASDASEVVVDLSGVTFIDSSGVGLIIAADRRSRADGNRLRLIRGPRLTQRVFELSGVTDRLPFVD